MTAIAEKYQIPGHANPSVDGLALVKVWLEKKDGKQWLMIIDNADDMNLFFPRSTQLTYSSVGSNHEHGLSDYVPECAHGAILITTRNKQLGVKLSKSQCAIEIARMDEDESAHLLRAKHIQATPSELLTLSIRLEHLPLALVQAAAYIHEMSITVAKYLELLGDTDQHMARLLSKEFETVGRDSRAPQAVAQTWMLSFQQIERQQTLASELMSLMSFLDRQEIPARFLFYYTQKKESENLVCDIDVTEALGVLKAFSFISEDKHGSYDMHRLVRLVTRQWLFNCGTTDRFGKDALLVVSDIFPFGKYETRATCGSYLSHANSVLQSCNFESQEEAKAKASLLHNMGGYLNFEGRWDTAEAMVAEAWWIRRDLLGESHPDTLISMENLSSIYWKQGRLDEAEKLEVQVMTTRKAKLGEDHLDTLISMGNLASLYREQGRLDEAEKLEMQVMTTSKEKLGEDHPHTLISMENLSSIYWKQGRLDEAEKLQVQVMTTRKAKLGEDHPHTLISMGSLASLYREQGRLDEAEKLEMQVMTTSKEKLGEDHPDTLISMHSLAQIWYSTGKQQEAIDLMHVCIQLQQTKLGSEHPSTISSMSQLRLWKS
jgi:tetratricopeptide (TPR) repeat protein